MVIFPAHIPTVAMRTSSWGTVQGGGEEGERWEARRDVQNDGVFFRKKERKKGDGEREEG